MIAREKKWVFPLLLRNGKAQALSGSSLPLGTNPDGKYEESTVPLQGGDALFFFTDGITEAKNEKGELFGFDRMEVAVRNLSPMLTAKEMVEAMLHEVQSFVGPARQHDDLTLVVCRVL